MANLNQNISTEFESEDKQSFGDKIKGFFSWIANWLGTTNAEKKIISAQQDQQRIDQLTEQYFNGDLDEETKASTLSEIQTLAKNRDEKLNYGNNNRFQKIFILPTTDQDVYTALRKSGSISDDDYQKLSGKKFNTSVTKTPESTSIQDKVNMLKKVTDQNQQDEQNSLVERYKADVADGKAKFDNTGESFIERYAKQNEPKGVQGYMQKFRTDVLGEITPKTFSLTASDGSQRTFFKDEAAEVLNNIIYLDDLYKPIENNYNVIKKIEGWLDSDNESERQYAESDYVQGLYNNAIKNLNNLKEETAYIYDNFERFDGDMAAIENQYAIDKGRKMFSDASNGNPNVFIRTPDEDFSSEDRGTAAVQRLNVDADAHIKEEYPTTYDLVLGNLYSPIKSTWHRGSFLLNTARDSLQDISNDAAQFTNTVYGFLQDEMSWADFDYIRQLDPNKVKESWNRSKEYASNVEMGMSSMMSLKDKLLDENKGWNKIYNTALAAADAGPSVSKEALTFALTEGLVNAMGITTTADMVAQTAAGSDKFAKVVAWNNGLLKFSEADIIKAKLMEFAGRGIVQNSILSASAVSNFSEEYSDLDFGLDVAFGFIDVFALGYGALIGKGKIFNEARKNIMRTALRDTLNITDDQWKILMSTINGRKLVDETSAGLWRDAVNAIKERAEQLGVSQDEIVNEMINASRNKTNTTQMIVRGDAPYRNRSNIRVEQEQLEKLQKTYRDIMNNALGNVVFSNPGKYSQSIVDKIGIVRSKSVNQMDDDVFYYRKKPLTYEEFAEIVEKSQIPALSKLWKKFENIFKKGKVTDIEGEGVNYKKQVDEVVDIDTSTAAGQVESDIKTSDLNKEYERLLKGRLAKNVNIDQYRRREYEKYGRPNNFEYSDVGYTALGVSETEEQLQQEVSKRIKEFASDYDKFYSSENKIKYTNPVDTSILTTGNIKLSEQMLGKKNLIGLSFDEAEKLNKNLAYTTEDFFNTVTNMGWLELYQKNAILWSIPEGGKFPNPNGTHIILDLKEGKNNVFGSSFEKDYIVGSFGTVGIAGIRLANGTEQKGAYIVYKDHINIRGEGFEYNLELKNGTIVSKIDMNIGFVPSFGNRYSYELKFYKDGRIYDKKIREFSETNPDEFSTVTNIQRVEDMLNRDWHSKTLGSIKDRNRYQSEDHDYYFTDRIRLMQAEHESGYLNVTDVFDVPFSYYVEIKKNLAIGRLESVKEGAVQLLLAAGSNVTENADYFIINSESSIKKNLLYFMFHQAGIILLPSNEVKYGGFKPYIYEREPDTLGRYNIYTSDNREVPIAELGINVEGSGKSYIKYLDTGNVEPLTDYRLSKYYEIDVDSDRFTNYKEEKYQKKRNMLFNDLIAKEKQGIYNTSEIDRGFDVTNEKDVANKFKIITSQGLGRNYNKDIKVKSQNVTEIKNIFNFKNLSLRLGNESRKQVSDMFYDWFDTIKLRVFKDKLGANTIDEGEAKLKELRNKGIDYEGQRVFATYDGDLAVIIDTTDMGFSVNYLKSGTDKVAINTLAFRVKSGKDKTRIVSIGNMPNMNVKEVLGETYLHVVDRGGINYFMKLDSTVEQQPRWRVNPLSLSDKDYNTFMEVPTVYERSIAGDQKYDFILDNLEAFPSEVTDMIIDGASVSDVYSYMKELTSSNEVMKGVIESWQLDLDTISIEDLFNVYNESLKLQRVINTLYEDGILESVDLPAKFFDYYKYITGADSITQNAFDKLIDLGLGVFVDDITEQNLTNWFRNIYKEVNIDYPVSGSYYSLAQFEILKYRVNEFIEKFDDYKVGLDLRTVEGRSEYLRRIQNGYSFATQVVPKEDIRNQYTVLRDSGVLADNLPANNMLVSLQTTTLTLRLLRDAKSKIKSNIRKGIFKENKGEYSGYKDFETFIKTGEYSVEFVESLEKEYDSWLDQFIDAITGYHTSKQALKQIDVLQNILKKRARKLIKKLSVGRLETPKVSQVEQDVRTEIKEDVEEVIEDIPAIDNEEIHQLDNKAKALVDKTDEGIDNSKEVQEYIEEKETIQNESKDEVEVAVEEFKKEEIKTEETQLVQTETKLKRRTKKEIKAENEETEIQEENNIEEQLKGDYSKVRSLKTEDLMGFTSIGLNAEIGNLLDGNTFLSLIEKLSEREGRKLPKGNLFLHQITKPILNAERRRLLRNKDNIALFLKSEEGMEYMLYSLYYHLSVPSDFIDKFNELFGTQLGHQDSFKDGFNAVYNTYKEYYGLNIEVQKGGMINVDRGQSSVTRSFFTQQLALGKDIKEDLVLKQADFGKTKTTGLNPALYDTNRISNKDGNKKFIKDYNKYLDSSLGRGAYRSTKYKSGPMSVYEYWTLDKLNKVRLSEGKKKIDKYMKDTGRYINPSYGVTIGKDEGTIGFNGFYELLFSPDNINEFKNEVGGYFDNQLFSPYFWNKKNEIETSAGNIKDTTVVMSVDYLNNKIDKIKDLRGKGINKVIVQGGNINELKSLLNKYPDLEYVTNKYLDEIEITPRYLDEAELKDAKKISGKNVEDSLQATCK